MARQQVQPGLAPGRLGPLVRGSPAVWPPLRLRALAALAVERTFRHPNKQHRGHPRRKKARTDDPMMLARHGPMIP